MPRLTLVVCVLAAAAATMAVADLAFAESRLFTVRSDTAGVTIAEAYRNGRQLAVGGSNGADTIFRIDNPSGAVPCTNRFRFVTSNGENVDTTVNLCSTNWDLTVSLAGIAGGGQGTVVGNPGSGQQPGVALPAVGQPVVVATDDPDVTIVQVFLRGRAVPIVARQDPYVQINLLGGPTGFECQRDLGLALSDARRIARLVDVCQTSFLVIVPLVGGPRPPPPPPGMQPQVTQVLPPPLPPAAPPAPPKPVPAPPLADPNFIDTMTWLFSAGSDGASLIYGVPNTDESAFMATCTPRSGKAFIVLDRTADEVGPGGDVSITFNAGGFVKAYTGRGTAVSQLDGLSHPALSLAMSDPLWAAMIKESALGVSSGTAKPYGISLRGSAVKVKQFLAVCGVPVVARPPPPPPPQPLPLPLPGPGNAFDYACDDGSYIQVSFDQSSAAVSEFAEPPVILFAVPAPVGGHWVAGPYDLRAQGQQIVWTRDDGFTRYCLRQ